MEDPRAGKPVAKMGTVKGSRWTAHVVINGPSFRSGIRHVKIMGTTSRVFPQIT